MPAQNEEVVLSQSSVSTSMSASGDSPSEDDDSSAVDLATCSNVQYLVKDGVHGVSYTGCRGNQEWTPVISRRKRRTIPEFLKRRFPPDHPIHSHQPDAESTESESEQDLSNVIPTGDNVTVNYTVVDNTPGLTVKTRCTRAWTPIAARTRARMKK